MRLFIIVLLFCSAALSQSDYSRLSNTELRVKTDSLAKSMISAFESFDQEDLKLEMPPASTERDQSRKKLGDDFVAANTPLLKQADAMRDELIKRTGVKRSNVVWVESPRRFRQDVNQLRILIRGLR